MARTPRADGPRKVERRGPSAWTSRDDFLPDRQTVDVSELEPVRLYDARGNEYWLRKRIGFLG